LAKNHQTNKALITNKQLELGHTQLNRTHTSSSIKSVILSAFLFLPRFFLPPALGKLSRLSLFTNAPRVLPLGENIGAILTSLSLSVFEFVSANDFLPLLRGENIGAIFSSDTVFDSGSLSAEACSVVATPASGFDASWTASSSLFAELSVLFPLIFTPARRWNLEGKC
jgi:hypothetical protein